MRVFFIINFYTSALSSTKEKVISQMHLTNNFSFNFIQKIDVTESINEAVRADIENKESEDLPGDVLIDKKSLTKDKEAIINLEEDSAESDYFNLLLEKIGF